MHALGVGDMSKIKMTSILAINETAKPWLFICSRTKILEMHVENAVSLVEASR